MNAAELARAMLEAKSEIDHALREYDVRIREDAEADKQAKLSHASAYLAPRAPPGNGTPTPTRAPSTSDTRRGWPKGSSGRRPRRWMSKRQWLSALQSIASLTRAEAQLAKWEPSGTVSA